MITATIAGNVGKDAELREAGNNDVCSFTVASQHPKDKEETIWVEVAVWGKRGEALSRFIRKGDKITVVGQLHTHKHEGKTYLKLDAFDVALQGESRSGSRDDRDDDRRSERDDRDRRDDRKDDRRRDDRAPARDDRKRGDNLPY